MLEPLNSGHPPLDGTVPKNKRYLLNFETNDEASAIARKKILAGRFVIISNVPSVDNNSLCAKGLLLT